ncbi:hypothetical protein L2E82_43940 [Cichorium intybus]|uniref:Uncharacterized protein n=1 Tax=Cichorium intybus TaxID=13427 RepID=A0ACB8ZPA6_CICIN|nr:hypothetical protein L2E82_43940 [Cichorium intybus]
MGSTTLKPFHSCFSNDNHFVWDVIWFRREEIAPIDSIEGFYSRGCSWPSEYRLKVINDIFEEVDKHIEEGDLVREFNMSALPILYDHLVKLIKYLEDRDQVVILFQDMHEVVTRDLMEDQFPNLDGLRYDDEQYQLFAGAPAGAILFSTPESKAWKEKINRLYLLLTVKESAMDVPSNLEARRRISFFSNSLFMDMPSAPKVRNILSFL